MHSRRKFLLQSTMAVGFFTVPKSLKNLKLLAADSGSLKLSVVNISGMRRKPPSHVLKSFSAALQKQKCHALILGSGDLVSAETDNKANHIEQLSKLKEAGLDFIVPGKSDLENGAAYFAEVAAAGNLAFISGDKNEVAYRNLLPFHVVDKGAIKVGIIANERAAENGTERNCRNEDAFAINETAAYLKTNHGCNLVILMHYENASGKKAVRNHDVELAGFTKHIDLVLSNDYEGNTAKTYIARNADQHEVIVNFSGPNTTELIFNKQMERTGFSLGSIV